MKMIIGLALVAGLVGGCSSKGSSLTAKDACAKLEAAGFAKGCHEIKPDMASARAAERYDFDLVAVPGQKGAVMSFASGEAYSATVKTYEDLAMLSGPHRYGNPGKLIFVQVNREMTLEDGKKLKAFVEGL